MTLHTVRRSTVGLLVAAAVAAPAAQGGHGDFGVRYALDRTSPVHEQWVPDAVDRALANEAGVRADVLDRTLGNRRHAAQEANVRSTQTRDGIGGHSATSSPVVAAESSEFDWGDASIGGGVALGLMLLLLGTKAWVGRKKGGGAPDSRTSVQPS